MALLGLGTMGTPASALADYIAELPLGEPGNARFNIG
jgi:hypothetical protein